MPHEVLDSISFKWDCVTDVNTVKGGILHWLDDDEFVMIFDRYILVHRILPFNTMPPIAPKCQTWCSRIDIDRSKTPILKRGMEILLLDQINQNEFRVGTSGKHWRHIADIFADPLFMTGKTSTTDDDTEETDSGAKVCQLVSERLSGNDSFIRRHLITFLLTDGVAYNSIKDGDEAVQTTDITSLLAAYVSANREEFIEVFPEGSNTTEVRNMETALHRLQRLGFVLWTSHWQLLGLRCGNNDVCRFAVSVQRSGDIFAWRYEMTETGLELTVVRRILNIGDVGVTSTATVTIDKRNCIVLLGSSVGNMYYCTISLDETNNIVSSSLKDFAIYNDSRRVTVISTSKQGDNEYIVAASRFSLLFCHIVQWTADNDIIITSPVEEYIPNRFGLSDICWRSNCVYLVSPDFVTKYRIQIDKRQSENKLELINNNVLALESERLFGYLITQDENLIFFISMKRFVDRNIVKKPLFLHMRSNAEPLALWKHLMQLKDLHLSGGSLLLARAYLLQKDTAKPMFDCISKEMQELDDSFATDDQLPKLKILRHSARILMAKTQQNICELDLAIKWSRLVDRIISISLARKLLENIDRTKCNTETNSMIYKMALSASMVLRGFDISVDDKIANVVASVKPEQCQFCNTESTFA